MMAGCAFHNRSVQEWVQIVRGEYEESPGLSLTCAQARRLWSLDAVLCDAVLERLIETGFLRRDHRAMFVRNDGMRSLAAPR
jgi:hypothetical protein